MAGTGAEFMQLMPGTWTQLPDCDWEVLLHGHYRGDRHGEHGLRVVRMPGNRARYSHPFAGWLIPLDGCYVRTAPSANPRTDGATPPEVGAADVPPVSSGDRDATQHHAGDARPA